MSTRISPGFSVKHTVVPGVYGAILLVRVDLQV